jgi:uncharacterized protein (DUF433 family)
MSQTEIDQLLNRITYDSGIFGGKAIIRGMRFRVVDVLELLAGGMTAQEILNDFPYLEREDIQACLYYAAQKLNHPRLHAA